MKTASQSIELSNRKKLVAAEELQHLNRAASGEDSSGTETGTETGSGTETTEEEDGGGFAASAATPVRRFPKPAWEFRRGPRYFWHRAVGLLCRVLDCRCRKRRPWEDPQVFSVGTVAPHSPLAAARADPEGGGQSLLLSGDWKFRFFPRGPLEAIAGGAERPSFDDSAWDTVPVPSHWQLLGYEPPTYTNMIYPFATCPCRRPSFAAPPAGVYRRHFRLPAGFAGEGRCLRLVLQGASAACSVWLNGRELGYHQDSGLPAEFDATEALSNGRQTEHVLVVRVLKWCDGSYLEDQDTWWLNGLFRDVVLYALPAANAIEDYYATTAVDAPYDEAADAELLVHARLRLVDGLSELRCTVLDGTEVLAEGMASPPEPAVGSLALALGKDTPVASCRLRLRAPAKWSPERPKLLSLVLQLRRCGELLQTERWRLGVRDVRVEGGQLRLNGKPLLINGVNRVEFHPAHGKALPPSVVREDLLLLKRHNFNAVRCAHCPNAPVFYELCDELGLLVVDEANIETHGFAMWGLLSFLQCDPAWRGAIFERVRAMFSRDKNHACIVGWSLGNEAGIGPNNASCATFLRRVDCTRWVQFESGEHHGDASLIMGNGRHPVSDLVCPMYADPEVCVRLAREERRPVVLCEYSHAMGNSNGALHLFYQLFRSEEYPSLQGGFIWDFADQGLHAPKWVRPKGPGDWFLSGHWGYGGDFGADSGSTDKWFCCNGLLLPDRTPKPAMLECRYLMQPVAFSAEWSPPRVLLKAASHEGTSLQGLVIRWVANDSHGRVLAQGSHTGGPSKAFALEAKLPAAPALWLRLRAELATDVAWAPAGHVVAEETLALSSPERGPSGPGAPAVCVGTAAPLVATPVGSGEGTVEVRDLGDERWEVRARNYSALVCGGGLTALSRAGGPELLSAAHGEPLSHAFWRLPTDNDRGGADVFMPEKLVSLVPWRVAACAGFPPSLAQQWLLAGLADLETRVCSSSWKGLSFTVETEHAAPGRPALFTAVTETTFGATKVQLSIQVRPDTKSRSLRGLPTLPRVGVRLVLPPAFSNVTWLGRGPHECYPDRKASTPCNVYRSTVEDMHFPYIVPGECAGRADVHWVALQDAQGRGLLVQYGCDDAAPPTECIESGNAGARPAATSGAQISASRFAPEHAHRTRHDFELPVAEDRPVVLHVDTAHCGVGGAGGATEAVWRCYRQHYIDPQTPQWSYSISLTPLAPGQLDVSCAAVVPAAKGRPRPRTALAAS